MGCHVVVLHWKLNELVLIFVMGVRCVWRGVFPNFMILIGGQVDPVSQPPDSRGVLRARPLSLCPLHQPGRGWRLNINSTMTCF